MSEWQDRHQRYQLLDEPQPGRLAHLVVHPMWPLLGLMLGGMWLALPWFLLNGFALGSATRKRELAIAVAGLAAATAVVTGILLLVGSGFLQGTGVHYAFLSLPVVKLTTGYLLFSVQQRSVAIYEHFGGTVRNGLLVVLAASFLRGPVLRPIPWDLLQLVLA